MIFISKHGNQIAEHMRRRRKAVQEQNCGSIPGTGFTIEDFQPLHVKRAIEDGRRNRFDLGRHRCLLGKSAISGFNCMNSVADMVDLSEVSTHSLKFGRESVSYLGNQRSFLMLTREPPVRSNEMTGVTVRMA